MNLDDTLSRLLAEIRQAREQGRAFDIPALLDLLEEIRTLGENLAAFAAAHIVEFRGLLAERHAP
jgi:hypothetical protein